MGYNTHWVALKPAFNARGASQWPFLGCNVNTELRRAQVKWDAVIMSTQCRKDYQYGAVARSVWVVNG